MNRLIRIIILAALVAALGIYFVRQPQGKVEKHAGEEPAGSIANFIKADPPKDLPAFAFTDAAGAAKDISVFKGQVVLLNLWATWCAPCRKEMPELSKLQRELGSPDFSVVTLSEDLKGYAASAKFLKEIGADNLPLYADEKAEALDALRAPGLPVTLLISRDGKELGRLVGPAPWASEEAKSLIKTVAGVK